MKKNFSIRLITNDEIKKVTDWARLEGFAPGFDDISIYKNTDKKGVWVGCIDDNPIGSIACIKYNSSYGFIGLFIVKKEFRNMGYGVKLWKHALDYLKHIDCIGLEAAPNRLDDYQKWAHSIIIDQHTNIPKRIVQPILQEMWPRTRFSLRVIYQDSFRRNLTTRDNLKSIIIIFIKRTIWQILDTL